MVQLGAPIFEDYYEKKPKHRPKLIQKADQDGHYQDDITQRPSKLTRLIQVILQEFHEHLSTNQGQQAYNHSFHARN